MRALVLLWGCLALRASATLSCPKELSGSEGETVTLRCTYGEEQRTRTKYWCREGGLFISRCSDKIIVGEDSREATKNRVSFRDSPSELAFTVTLRDLMLKDSGKYWCGAQKLGREEWFEVSLTVFPTCPSPRSACWPRSWCSCPSCWPWASSPWVPTCSGLGSQHCWLWRCSVVKRSSSQSRLLKQTGPPCRAQHQRKSRASLSSSQCSHGCPPGLWGRCPAGLSLALSRFLGPLH
ncbi:CMRF35-like molecule 9 isoform X6 [Cavia porcellus]|uniref:CMRF35-like molecule 9 isoform X6 n=1 Tax=Cavia porcellus TaxID=10141 RepID=UPI000661D453|nr:CMRF35-like molecule 9 isoform X3 [Cavia porcellus]